MGEPDVDLEDLRDLDALEEIEAEERQEAMAQHDEDLDG